MKSLINEISPFVIEFSGTPRTGKTSLMNNLKDFFKKEGFKVLDVCEFFFAAPSVKQRNNVIFCDVIIWLQKNSFC